MNRKATARPFGMRDKAGYLFGDFGNDFTFIFSTMMLMKFYTDVMGVSAGVVGLVMTVARVVDAFTDVTMGRICDRSRPTPAGKFKPWLRRMCLPVALASFLIYQSGMAGAPMGVKIAYLFVTYILWGSVFYTSINIPYGSMASAISADPDDRQSLSTFRTLGGTMAGVVIGVILPLVAYEKVDGVEALIGPRVTLAAGVASVLAVICYLLCYHLVTERVQIPVSDKKQDSVWQMLKSAVHNRALISIIAASIVMLLAQLTIQNMSGYVYPDYYNNASAQAASNLTMMVAMLLAAALSGLLLEAIGYSAATRTDAAVQAGLFNISVLVPALGFALLALILWFWYPLHKKQVDENVRALKEKHAREAN